MIIALTPLLSSGAFAEGPSGSAPATLFGLQDGLYGIACGEAAGDGDCGRLLVRRGRESLCLMPGEGSTRVGDRLFGAKAEVATFSRRGGPSERQFLKWCTRRLGSGAPILNVVRPWKAEEATSTKEELFATLRPVDGKSTNPTTYLHSEERSLGDGSSHDDGFRVELCRTGGLARSAMMAPTTKDEIRDQFQTCDASNGKAVLIVDVGEKAYDFGDGVTELVGVGGGSYGISGLFWVSGTTETGCVVTVGGEDQPSFPAIHPHPGPSGSGGQVEARAHSGNVHSQADLIQWCQNIDQYPGFDASLVQVTSEAGVSPVTALHIGLFGVVYEKDEDPNPGEDRILEYWYTVVDGVRWVRSCKNPARAMPPAVTAYVAEASAETSYADWTDEHCRALDSRKWWTVAYSVP